MYRQQNNKLTELPQTNTNFLMRLSYYPWIVIMLSALFLFYKYILQVSPSLMTDGLMRFFHIDGAGLGNLAATFFYAYVVMQLFAGPLLDKFSPRVLTSLAILVTAMGALSFSFADYLWVADLSRALIGVGAAFATVSYMKMAALWFRPSQFAFVSGLLATASMLGALFGEAPMALLINVSGWRHAILYVALIGVVLAIVFFLFVRDAKDPQRLNAAQTKKITFKDILSILKRPHNWYLMFYSGLAFAPVAIFGGLWGNPFMEEAYHIVRTEAASLTSLMFLGLACGGPLFGLLSDRLGKRIPVMAVGVVLSIIAVIGVLYINLPIWLLACLLFLFGFGTGAFMIGFVIAKEINALALAATVIGMINTGDAIFGAFSEPLTGRLLDLFWHGKMVAGVQYFSVASYRLALTILPIYLLAALAFLIVFTRCKQARELAS